jgi:hypothetical protein
MATERDTGTTTIVERRGGGGMGAIIGVAVVAIIALVAVFLVVNANRDTPGERIADAASSIAGSAERAADSVADSTPAAPAPAAP